MNNIVVTETYMKYQKKVPVYYVKCWGVLLFLKLNLLDIKVK